MGEFEILDTDEPLPKRIERHAFDRLIMLSDGVFAIAITLLTLELRPPAHWDGTARDLLAQTWRPLLGFGMSFLIVGSYWAGHRRIFARLRRVDGPATVLTLLLLGLVALAPAFTELVATFGPRKAMPLYLSFVAIIGIVQAMLWGYACFGGKLVDTSIYVRERLTSLAALAVLPVLYIVFALLLQSNVSETTLTWQLFLLPAIVIGARLLARKRGKL